MGGIGTASRPSAFRSTGLALAVGVLLLVALLNLAVGSRGPAVLGVNAGASAAVVVAMGGSACPGPRRCWSTCSGRVGTAL